MSRNSSVIFITAAFLTLFTVRISAAEDDSGSAGPDANSSIVPESTREGFHWNAALTQSFLASTIANGERFLNEKGTRDAIQGPFLHDYLRTMQNFHGWDDGDGFLTSYIAHPMEGAFAGFVERQNDPRYRSVEFGRSQRYWTSCMRSLAFATAYSTSWSLGPYGEASLGNVGLHAPPGLIDLVGTETMGLAWMIGEDAVDRYLIKRIENRYRNRWVRRFSRSMLNPMRSYANLLRFEMPWVRDSREGPITYDPQGEYTPVDDIMGPHFRPDAWPAELPFELSAKPLAERYLGGHGSTCVGGGGEGALKAGRNWQLDFEIDGCTLWGLQRNISGDVLNYMVGPRWSPAGFKRWTPYAHVLIGGTKITHEHFDPQKKQLLVKAARAAGQPDPEHTEYTSDADSNGVTLLTGGGVYYHLTESLLFRVAGLDYQRSWAGRLEGLDYQSGLRFSMGLAFRMGPWRN